MIYTCNYKSPIGNIVIKSDGENLTSLQFLDRPENICENIDIFDKVTKWLDNYFSRIPSDIDFPLLPNGTIFQNRVWSIVKEIPYGQTICYSDIADMFYKKYNIKTSCRAVGHAISKNPILLVIPCHRVIGKNGQMTGYSAGVDKKIKLLHIENKKV